MIIPQGDESRPLSSVPIALILIIATNIVVFLVEWALGDSFVLRYSMKPAEIVRGEHFETLFTSMFMHASVLHIVARAQSGVAYFAHIGGFVAGLLLVKPFAVGQPAGTDWG